MNKDFFKVPVKLIILDNFISSGELGKTIPNHENVEFIEHNVIKPFNTRKKIDFIVHAAGIASPFYYRANPMETLEVAINGTKLMLELEKKSLKNKALSKIKTIKLENHNASTFVILSNLLYGFYVIL